MWVLECSKSHCIFFWSFLTSDSYNLSISSSKMTIWALEDDEEDVLLVLESSIGAYFLYFDPLWVFAFIFWWGLPIYSSIDREIIVVGSPTEPMSCLTLSSWSNLWYQACFLQFSRSWTFSESDVCATIVPRS